MNRLVPLLPGFISLRKALTYKSFTFAKYRPQWKSYSHVFFYKNAVGELMGGCPLAANAYIQGYRPQAFPKNDHYALREICNTLKVSLDAAFVFYHHWDQTEDFEHSLKKAEEAEALNRAGKRASMHPITLDVMEYNPKIPAYAGIGRSESAPAR